MTTEAKREANRRNALKSTGPRTPKGKSTVARNAVKHGLLSREVLLPDENRSAFRAMAANLCDTLQPEGAVELLLVERIAAATWRLRRVQKIETDLCDTDKPGRKDLTPGTRFIQDSWGPNAFLKLSRYETAIERSLYRALREFERVQTKRLSARPAKPVDVGVFLRSKPLQIG